jgi:hypothetical protein
MAEKNIIMQRKKSDGTYDQYYPKTKVENVDGALKQADLDAHISEKATLTKLAHVQHDTLTVTLSTAWSGSTAPFTKTQSVSGILATDNPVVDVVMSGAFATDEKREEAWGNIYRITTANNSITLYAMEKPTVSLPIQLKVVR